MRQPRAIWWQVGLRLIILIWAVSVAPRVFGQRTKTQQSAEVSRFAILKPSSIDLRAEELGSEWTEDVRLCVDSTEEFLSKSKDPQTIRKYRLFALEESLAEDLEGVSGGPSSLAVFIFNRHHDGANAWSASLYANVMIFSTAAMAREWVKKRLERAGHPNLVVPEDKYRVIEFVGPSSNQVTTIYDRVAISCGLMPIAPGHYFSGPMGWDGGQEDKKLSRELLGRACPASVGLPRIRLKLAPVSSGIRITPESLRRDLKTAKFRPVQSRRRAQRK